MREMAPMAQLSEIQVEQFVFPPTMTPPSSTESLFLGGAGLNPSISLFFLASLTIFVQVLIEVFMDGVVEQV